MWHEKLFSLQRHKRLTPTRNLKKETNCYACFFFQFKQKVKMKHPYFLSDWKIRRVTRIFLLEP